MTETKIIEFASKEEAHRFGQLCMLERAGFIRGLRDHPSIEVYVHGCYQGVYTSDAEFWEGDVLVWEDTKGWHKDMQRQINRIKEAAAVYPRVQFRIVDKHGLIKRHWINGIEQPRLRKNKLVSPLNLRTYQPCK